jgi:hypothetical protein
VDFDSQPELFFLHRDFLRPVPKPQFMGISAGSPGRAWPCSFSKLVCGGVLGLAEEFSFHRRTSIAPSVLAVEVGLFLELLYQRFEFFRFLSYSCGRFSVTHTKFSVKCA